MMRKTANWMLAFGCLVVVTMWLAQDLGLRYNYTPSMPLGVWHTQQQTAYHRNDVVEACLPGEWNVTYLGAGNCPSGKQPVLKVAAAVAGDLVRIDDDGIRVNGLLLENTRPLEKDGRGTVLHAFPQGEYDVPMGQVWLVGQEPTSFDSRYFGPVKTETIRGAAQPLWTWQ